MSLIVALYIALIGVVNDNVADCNNIAAMTAVVAEHNNTELIVYEDCSVAYDNS